jgi:hypothetical protein
MANRSAEGGGGSHRESSLLPTGLLGVIYNSQLHGHKLFIAIRIRVKVFPQDVSDKTNTTNPFSKTLSNISTYVTNILIIAYLFLLNISQGIKYSVLSTVRPGNLSPAHC